MAGGSDGLNWISTRQALCQSVPVIDHVTPYTHTRAHARPPRLIPTAMQGHPPPHQRFANKKIPAHITYAYKKDATIVKNNDFYRLPQAGSKRVDLLFVIANAPVKTASLPDAGSESYVGLAGAMELAMYELFDIFPGFFEQAIKSSQQSET